jgi:hypothetical protein
VHLFGFYSILWLMMHGTMNVKIPTVRHRWLSFLLWILEFRISSTFSMTLYTTIFTCLSQDQQGRCRGRKQAYTRTFSFYSIYGSLIRVLWRYIIWTTWELDGQYFSLYNAGQGFQTRRKTSYPEPNFRHFLLHIGVGSEIRAYGSQ